nr:RNA-directed DNA polymerase, eukaryota, reverse transcriptase zinc-binding domain protein [Tanacetum cinerariifolium]
VDQGMVTDDIFLSRMDLMKQLHDVQSSNNRDVVQKAKVLWAIEEDENSKYFHAIINRKRAHLSVKGVLVDGDWTAFLPNRQILDGPFIVNEILSRWKAKNHQAMFFKVDFAKAYDSVRWDFLYDVLNSFGFGSKWRSWIRGSLCSGKASILVNGSPTAEFQFHRGIKINSSLNLSYLFYADDAVFIGEWSN